MLHGHTHGDTQIMNTETKKKTAKASKGTAKKDPKKIQVIEGMNLK